MTRKTTLDKKEDVRKEWNRFTAIMQLRFIKALRIVFGVGKDDA